MGADETTLAKRTERSAAYFIFVGVCVLNNLEGTDRGRCLYGIETDFAPGGRGRGGAKKPDPPRQ
jgi:hypothetical protein